MLDLNEQTNKYYNFLTDLHIHCKVSKLYFLSHLASAFRIKRLANCQNQEAILPIRFPKQFLINIQKFEKNSSLQGLNFMPLLACDILVCFLY